MTFLAKCKALVAEYVALLVPDWQIEVEVAKLYPVLGECYPSWEYKGGLLRFHDRDAYPVDRDYDLDLTVAHEVGHCVLAVMCTESGTWQRRAEEWIVETFARAMVALRRGLRAAPAKLAEEMRHLVRNTVVRRRMASADRKRRMVISKETAQAALDAIAAGDTGPALEVLKTIIAEQLAGAAPDPEIEEPAADPAFAADPAGEPPKDPNEPAMRAAVVARVDADLRQAAADATRTKALARKGLVTALLDSAPDVFPPALPARRARYASAEPAEIERYIASAREDAAIRQGDPKPRIAPQTNEREPAGSGGPPLAGAPKGGAPMSSVIPITRTGMFAGGEK